ncbi:MAG: hypothetical protein ACI4QB_03095 [Eubacteriales bacterium]
MIKITEQQKAVLSPFIPELQEYIVQDDVDALLADLDFAIIDQLDEKQDHLSRMGVRLQHIYDELLAQNE